MKSWFKTSRILSLLIPSAVLWFSTGGAAGAEPAKSRDVKSFLAAPLQPNEISFIYLGSSGLILRLANQVLLIDPAAYLDAKDVEALGSSGVSLILYTHGHGDHFDAAKAIQLYNKFQPVMICAPGVASSLAQKIPAVKLISAATGKTYTAGNISVDAVEGIHPGSITLYRLTVGGITLFHAGDSGYVPLAKYSALLAFLPAGGASPTASPENALHMATDLNPRTAVIFHGKDDQYTSFKTKLNAARPAINVVIPETGKSETITL